MKKIVLAAMFLTACCTVCEGKCLSGDCQNGVGKATLAGVKTFTGPFAKGNPAGQGVMNYSNGVTIKGAFDGWEPGGDVVLVCPDRVEHNVRLSDKSPRYLVRAIADSCKKDEPVQIDFEEEAAIQRDLDRVAVSERNLRIAAHANTRRAPAMAREEDAGNSRGGLRCQELLDAISAAAPSSKSTIGSMIVNKGKRAALVQEYELRCMAPEERQEHLERRRGEAIYNKLGKIERTQQEIQNRQRGIPGY